MTRAVGPDLSRYNVSFDPSRATEPIDFAFQKATQGANYVDLEYENIWQGVKQIQVRGAYHYQNGESWLAQADHFLRTAEKHDYHIHALDLEQYGNAYNDTFFADAKRIVDRWRAMSDKKVVIYTNGSTYDQLYLTLLRLYGEAGALWLDGTSLWIASPTIAGLPILPRYRTNKDWLIHQYTWKGDPSRWGTGGTAVDENVFCGDMNTFRTYFDLDGDVYLPPIEIGEPMRYEAVNLYPDMSLRDFHNTGGKLIAKYPANTVFLGDVIWTAPSDLFISGVKVNQAGDRWLEVKNVAGVDKSGWVAITHKGSIYCTLTEINPPPVEPPPPADVELTHTVEVYSDGSLKVDGVSFE